MLELEVAFSSARLAFCVDDLRSVEDCLVQLRKFFCCANIATCIQIPGPILDKFGVIGYRRIKILKPAVLVELAAAVPAHIPAASVSARHGSRVLVNVAGQWGIQTAYVWRRQFLKSKKT
eukprot:TRINITY_DN18564_c0_g1_i7.p1 TRINITY_DN18564_c0_g1~~TRINITY_DN18564_c0_g1_i7.p1  ORF type:complete len:120 (-),score=4.71 TRINITY_DN18564_c0_g1_i7:269-628(-)